MADGSAPVAIISPPFVIERYQILPGDTVEVPLGEVLAVDFVAKSGFAWIKHHPAEEGQMQLVTLPTSNGQVFTLETARGFKPPFFVGSLLKKGNIQVHKGLESSVATAWHVFAYHPIVGSATFLQPPAITLQ